MITYEQRAAVLTLSSPEPSAVRIGKIPSLHSPEVSYGQKGSAMITEIAAVISAVATGGGAIVGVARYFVKRARDSVKTEERLKRIEEQLSNPHSPA